MRRHLHRAAILAAIAIDLCALAGCSKSPAACAIGSEACDCTAGGACDPGLVCRSNLCVSLTTGGALCNGYCETPSNKCGIPSSYVPACISDCESRTARQPAPCATTTWPALLRCAGMESSWTCGATQATNTGCDPAAAAHDDCLRSAGFGTSMPAPRCKAYPGGVAIAKLNEGFATGTKTSVSVVFQENGAVSSVDQQTCTQVAGMNNPMSMVAWADCLEAYECGGCEVWIAYDFADKDAWYLLGVKGATGACASYSGFYDLTAPPVVTPGGGGSGPDNACSACSDACSGIPGCSCCAECGGFCFN